MSVFYFYMYFFPTDFQSVLCIINVLRRIYSKLWSDAHKSRFFSPQHKTNKLKMENYGELNQTLNRSIDAQNLIKTDNPKRNRIDNLGKSIPFHLDLLWKGLFKENIALFIVCREKSIVKKFKIRIDVFEGNILRNRIEFSL